MMKDIAENKKAFHDYFIEDKFEAGIVLVGSEVKSLRAGNVNLKDSYAILKNGEIFLLNVHIKQYEKSTYDAVDPTRTRKLLLKKSEIEKIERKIKEKHNTLVPLKIYFSDSGKVKVLLATASGKKLFDKKEALKEKDINKELRREKVFLDKKK